MKSNFVLKLQQLETFLLNTDRFLYAIIERKIMSSSTERSWYIQTYQV